MFRTYLFTNFLDLLFNLDFSCTCVHIYISNLFTLLLKPMHFYTYYFYVQTVHKASCSPQINVFIYQTEIYKLHAPVFELDCLVLLHVTGQGGI